MASFLVVNTRQTVRVPHQASGPTPSDEEITRQVGRVVADYFLEFYPNESKKQSEMFNDLKKTDYCVEQMFFLGGLINRMPMIKVDYDDKIESEGPLTIALLERTILVPYEYEKTKMPSKATDLKGNQACLNRMLDALSKWEAIEGDKGSSKHQVKRSRIEQKRIHRLVRKSKKKIDGCEKETLWVSQKAMESIRNYGLTLLNTKQKN